MTLFFWHLFQRYIYINIWLVFGSRCSLQYPCTKSLCITSLFFGLSSGYDAVPFRHGNISYSSSNTCVFIIVILSNLFCVRTCFPFFVILQLNVAGDFIFLQIQEILPHCNKSTIYCYFFQNRLRMRFYAFQNRSMCYESGLGHCLHKRGQ